MDIDGKVAVVTGGGSGIGRAIAVALAKHGADVVIAGRTAGTIERVRQEIVSLGRRALAVPTDVAKLEDVESLFRQTVQAMGRADILVNNAGVHMLGKIEDVTMDDWHWIVDVNFWGVVHGVKAFLPHLLERGSGHIVNTASIAGLVGGLDESIPYSTTKFAVVGLSEGLAAYLRPRGIGVTVLCPGLILTNLMDGQRIAQPDDQTVNRAWDSVSNAMRRGDWSYMGDDVLEAGPVGDLVAQAIGDNRFLVLTHPLHEQILAGRAQDPEGAIVMQAQRLQDREAAFKAMAKSLGDS